MLQDGIVAEVVLVRGLDAESPLSSHASHRLAHVERPHILDLGQTDVQRTEGSCTGVKARTVSGELKKKKNSKMKSSFLETLNSAGLGGFNNNFFFISQRSLAKLSHTIKKCLPTFHQNLSYYFNFCSACHE